MWPRAYTVPRITVPKASATPTCVTVPPDHASAAAAPGPRATNMKVPTASAAKRGPRARCGLVIGIPEGRL